MAKHTLFADGAGAEMKNTHRWYVMQVRTGTEENICVQCRKNMGEDILDKCFLPYYEEKRKVQGEWKILKKILFPGYVFVITKDIEELYRQLKKVVGLTKLLGAGKEIVPLTGAETAFLLRFGGEELTVAMSEGIIEGEKVFVRSGPLQGMEGYIRKIDRHKRKAYLEIPLFGRTQNVQVGLEIVEKKA